MSKALHYINLAGILAVAGLCVVQWVANRSLNLDVARLTRVGFEQAAKLEEARKARADCAADLEGFRDRVTQASQAERAASEQVTKLTRELGQAVAERDGAQGSLSAWEKAVADRDAQIKLGNEQIGKLAATRDQAVARYNELAEKYSGVVKDLNEARAQLAAAKAAPEKK
ncbi:MAG TPA: hypothetical protein VMF06_02465 [Candidatus Limnocylindria bacterium]|nr:hypothetical protein [Candidatus Limnocylindria bacterium]